MVVDVIDEENLSEEEITKIANKKWKTAKLPSEDKLKKEESESNMARNNINSRKNLIQYREDKPKEVKESVVKNLKKKKKRVNVNPFDYITVKDSDLKRVLKSLLPPRTVLSNANEEKSFYTMINSLLRDYSEEDLTSSDLDDIVTLAKNNIIVNRLLQHSSKDPDKVIDVANSVEKFNKQIKSVKQNLASRRADRIDPKNKQGFSIIDLVHKYEKDEKRKFDIRIKEWERQKKELLDKKPVDNE